MSWDTLAGEDLGKSTGSRQQPVLCKRCARERSRTAGGQHTPSTRVASQGRTAWTKMHPSWLRARVCVLSLISSTGWSERGVDVGRRGGERERETKAVFVAILSSGAYTRAALYSFCRQAVGQLAGQNRVIGNQIKLLRERAPERAPGMTQTFGQRPAGRGLTSSWGQLAAAL